VSVNADTHWITGGVDENGDILDTTDVLFNDFFRFGGNLPAPIAGHCMAAMGNDRVFMATGTAEGAAWILEGGTGKILQELPNLPGFNLFGASCGYFKGTDDTELLVVAGGYVGGLDDEDDVAGRDEVFLYDFSEGLWLLGNKLPLPLYNHRAVQEIRPDGSESFIILGGRSESSGRSNEVVYRFGFDHWAVATPIVNGVTSEYFLPYAEFLPQDFDVALG